MGDDTPRPDRCAVHAMFSVGLQRTGSPVSLDAPVPATPRHCDQFSAASGDPMAQLASTTAVHTNTLSCLMAILLYKPYPTESSFGASTLIGNICGRTAHPCAPALK